jgi:hypothetical protein
MKKHKANVRHEDKRSRHRADPLPKNVKVRARRKEGSTSLSHFPNKMGSEFMRVQKVAKSMNCRATAMKLKLNVTLLHPGTVTSRSFHIRQIHNARTNAPRLAATIGGWLTLSSAAMIAHRASKSDAGAPLIALFDGWEVPKARQGFSLKNAVVISSPGRNRMARHRRHFRCRHHDHP